MEINNQQNLDMIQYNKKNYKMSLLFIQTKELKRFYNSKMENILRKYHLVDKSWLDDFKAKNDYKSADMFDSFNDWKTYEDFREVMGDSFLVEDNLFTRMFISIACKKEKYKYDINFPINAELVCLQYFLDCLKGTVICPTCDILIGDKSIIIVDNESKSKNKAVIFICSLIGREEDYNFCINVEHIINYNNLNIMNAEFKEISISGGINNYLLKRKINVNKNEEQNVIDSKNNFIGKFIHIEINNKENNEAMNNKIRNPIYNLDKIININNNPNINNSNGNINNKYNNNMQNFSNNFSNQNINNQNNIINNNSNNGNFGINAFSMVNLGNNNRNNNNNINYDNMIEELSQTGKFINEALNIKGSKINYGIHKNNQNLNQNNNMNNINFSQNYMNKNKNGNNNINNNMFQMNNNMNQYNNMLQNSYNNMNQYNNMNNNFNPNINNYNNSINSMNFISNNINFNNNMPMNMNYFANNMQNYNNINNNMNMSNNNTFNCNMNNNMNNMNNQQFNYNNMNDDEFNLHFRYKSKEVVLYVNPNMKFSDIQNELIENYESFKKIKIKGFSFRNEMINPNYTCNQLNINSNSKIKVIEY